MKELKNKLNELLKDSTRLHNEQDERDYYKLYCVKNGNEGHLVQAQNELQALLFLYSDSFLVKENQPVKENEILIPRNICVYGVSFYNYDVYKYCLIDLNEITIKLLNDKQLARLNEIQNKLQKISNDVEPTSYLYIKGRNGNTEEQKNAYNFFMYQILNKNLNIISDPRLLNDTIKYLKVFYHYDKERAQRDYKKHLDDIKKIKIFSKNFIYMFESSLHFNYWFETNWSGRDSISILRAKESAKAIESYNEFNYKIFSNLVDYLQNNFVKYFNEYNPNNYNNNFDISLGRESSVVCYIRVYYNKEMLKNKNIIEKNIKRITNCDEFSEEENFLNYFNDTEVLYRLWWD